MYVNKGMCLFKGIFIGPPRWLSGKESTCQDTGDMGLVLGLGRSPEEGNGNPLVFLPGNSHGQRSLAGHGPWGCKELHMTEHIHTHIHVYMHELYCGFL